eukprot:NODE_1728_length_1081_cov_238.041667_g1272_i1.p1 GENE.NODE_1728_length_1081_cov_238.041667_g1272_i1~~NODE_1728_length_1081_cov_238.041667_g1272_i1.p1  ORF type:complete len:306 (+),score=40.67 NODE_1728_length_1081_cov_238.041667_g1272_i1:60-977(+)
MVNTVFKFDNRRGQPTPGEGSPPPALAIPSNAEPQPDSEPELDILPPQADANNDFNERCTSLKTDERDGRLDCIRLESEACSSITQAAALELLEASDCEALELKAVAHENIHLSLSPASPEKVEPVDRQLTFAEALSFETASIQQPLSVPRHNDQPEPVVDSHPPGDCASTEEASVVEAAPPHPSTQTPSTPEAGSENETGAGPGVELNSSLDCIQESVTGNEADKMITPEAREWPPQNPDEEMEPTSKELPGSNTLDDPLRRPSVDMQLSDKDSTDNRFFHQQESSSEAFSESELFSPADEDEW